MCGIAGFADYKRITDRATLEKMTRIIAHRGPDGEGYAIYKNAPAIVGLGHRRLSILDLSDAGSQPFTYEHLHITFNGEVYNFSEIKTELLAKGHLFHSHSDTEVILHAYAEWGNACLQKFIGMFSFAIYDEKEQNIFGCRDRAGVKPFFYYRKDGLFLFASELKAFTEHPQFEKNIDTDAAAAFMQYGYVPAPNCIFRNAYKLKPGHFFNYSLKNNEFKIEQYWNVYDAYNKPEIKIDLPQAISETEKLLTNAFQYRMVSDVPVGVFLSGGYDSACVTALLQKDSTEKIKTFTIGIPDAGLNEAPFAKEIATKLGTDHTEFYCTEKEALEIITEIPFFYDEPFADSSAIPTMLVSRIAREKVTVALSADGGDEIFAGYSRYGDAIKNFNRLNKIPAVLRKPIASLMSTANPVVNRKQGLFQQKYQKLRGLLHDPSEVNFLKTMTQLSDKKEINALFKTAISELSSDFDNKELSSDRFSLLHYIMAIDYKTYMADDILQKVDRAGMSVSLEGREPFLDHRIIEWAAQLPLNFKIRNGNKKFILKEIVHQYLPHQMMDRPKMGFGIPVNDWLRSELRPFVDQHLSEDAIKKQNIFDYTEIRRIKNAFFETEQEKPEKIWHLLMFQMWYERWMS